MIPRAAAWAELQLRTRALGVVLGALEDAGVPALPIKGALLVHELYDDPAERPLRDVDLLVRPRDFLRALGVARARGLRVLWDSKMLGNVNFVTGGVVADVACTLGPPGTSALSVDRMLARATREIAPLGVPHWRIDLHDHVLVMVVDAFKDKLLSKPTAREDLLRLGAHARWDAATLVARAQQAGLLAVTAIVAAWLSPDSPGWAELAARLPRTRPGYVQAYLGAIARGGAAPASLGLRLLTRAAADRPLRRAWALALGALGTLHYSARHGVLPGRDAPSELAPQR